METKIQGIPSYDRLEAKRKRVCVPRLFGVAEVSESLGVQAPNLQFIKDLPQPVTRVRATRLWLADEIEAFAKIYNTRRVRRGHVAADQDGQPEQAAAAG